MGFNLIYLLFVFVLIQIVLDLVDLSLCKVKVRQLLDFLYML